MKLTAVIVDDERRGRELLAQLLGVYCPEVQVLAAAATVDEAIEVINLHHPDMLFLDIRIGTGFGFDVLPALTEPLPSIIVTTAHQEYAIKALKVQALDYLLKPIVSDELKSAVRKVQEHKEKTPSGSSPITSSDQKIAIPTAEGYIFLKTERIIRCEASGAYTEIYLKEGSKLVTSTNLGEFEKLLPESWGFLRVHHSSIINMAEVTMYIKAEGGSVLMSDKSKVTVSQRKKSAFLEAVKKYARF